MGLCGCVSHLYENEVCAGFCQGDGDGLSDASCSTGQEGGLALQGEESVGLGGHADFVIILMAMAMLMLMVRCGSVC